MSMITADENELISRVEGDAPMGRVLRAHWIPACLSEELPEPDCDPVRVRLLGEDLVAFRDTDGRVGLIDEHCPHRRASLFYGRNEECGLRCLYHGWKFDIDGNCLEMASEPPESSFCDKVKVKSYPVVERAGFVWAWMGAREAMPEFDPPVVSPAPDTPISTCKVIVEANWAQLVEGSLDSAHTAHLHADEFRPAQVASAESDGKTWQRPSTDRSPRLYVERTSFGLRYAAVRRPIKNAHTHDYVRNTLYIAPYTVHIPPNNRHELTAMFVPRDDNSSVLYLSAWGGKQTPGLAEWRKFICLEVGIDVDETYRNLRNRSNNYKQDRQRMRLGSMSGIKGIITQDIFTFETMGAIAQRNRERLGASDIAIVEFRRQLVDAVRAAAAGGPILGATEPRIPQAQLKSFEGVVPKGLDWRTLGCSDVELDIVAKQRALAGKADAAE
jgi:phthalate 4,5-dioxygenase oxygenase subunit